jgi:hypothetical protein
MGKVSKVGLVTCKLAQFVDQRAGISTQAVQYWNLASVTTSYCLAPLLHNWGSELIYLLLVGLGEGKAIGDQFPSWSTLNTVNSPWIIISEIRLWGHSQAVFTQDICPLLIMPIN